MQQIDEVLTPIMSHNAFESDFQGTRDALLHLGCGTAEYLGFKTCAWSTTSYNYFNQAFEACAKAQLQPRFVVVSLIQAIDREDPADDLPSLVRILKDIIAKAEAHENSKATILVM